MMRALGTSWLPLLRKELVEQAARKRTYITRFLFGGALVLVFCVMAYTIFRQQQILNAASFQGQGADLFDVLLGLQFAAVFLFLPAMMSGVVTAEKERDSLSLLLLSRLRPWEILLEKYLSRLIPLFALLMLAFPLHALAYSLGGVSASSIATGAWLLVLTSLQVGAISLCCSCYCRTSVSAFILSYLLIAAAFLGWPIFAGLLEGLSGPFWFLMGSRGGGEILYVFLTPDLWYVMQRITFDEVIVRSIPAVLCVFGLLAMARAFFLRRAVVQPRHLLLKVFRRLDTFFEGLNEWTTGGIVLVKDKVALPRGDPVYWREVTKKSLGRVSYLFRILVAIEVPVAALGVIFLQFGAAHRRDDDFAIVVFILWCFSALAVSAISPNAIISERNSMTLDVLLTTPMSGRDILLQKMRALRRLLLTFLIPFATLFLMQAWEAPDRLGRGLVRATQLGPWEYLIGSLALVVVYLPLFAWVSFWLGLKLRRRATAIIVAVVMITLWCVVPALILALLDDLRILRTERNLGAFLWLLSPATAVVLTQTNSFGELFRFSWAPPLIINIAWYLGIMYLVRSRCLRHADRYLGRSWSRYESAPDSPEAPDPEARIAE